MRSLGNVLYRLSPVWLVIGIVLIVMNWQYEIVDYQLLMPLIVMLGGLFGTFMRMLEALD